MKNISDTQIYLFYSYTLILLNNKVEIKMIELSQKEVEAVSGGFGLFSKIICFKVNLFKSIFNCFIPKCQPKPTCEDDRQNI